MRTLPNEQGAQEATGFNAPIYLQILLPWVIAFGIWGFIFSHTAVVAAIGALLGLIGCLVTGMALKSAQTIEKRKEMIAASGMLWGAPPILIGIVGLVVLVIKKIV